MWYKRTISTPAETNIAVVPSLDDWNRDDYFPHLPRSKEAWWEDDCGNSHAGQAYIEPQRTVSCPEQATVALENTYTPPQKEALSLKTSRPDDGHKATDEDTEEDNNSIDGLLTQLLKISKKSPNASYESLKNILQGKSEEVTYAPQVNQTHQAIFDCLTPESLNKSEYDGLWHEFGLDEHDHDLGVSSNFFDLRQDSGSNRGRRRRRVSCPESSHLTPEEEAAICALVPKLVRVSISKPVRGVYLDRRRGLWRANWREDGKVKTKGFRIAQWGEQEARRKAIEVRKLMETRGCFLKLKAVAMGDAQRELNACGGLMGHFTRELDVVPHLEQLPYGLGQEYDGRIFDKSLWVPSMVPNAPTDESLGAINQRDLLYQAKRRRCASPAMPNFGVSPKAEQQPGVRRSPSEKSSRPAKSAKGGGELTTEHWDKSPTPSASSSDGASATSLMPQCLAPLKFPSPISAPLRTAARRKKYNRTPPPRDTCYSSHESTPTRVLPKRKSRGLKPARRRLEI